MLVAVCTIVSALAPRSRPDVHYMEYRPYSITIIGMVFFKDGTELKDFAFFKSITFQLLSARNYLSCGKCASS